MGKNHRREIEFGDGLVLGVKNIFKTIKGEGVFQGLPAIFVRLGGCNLNCSFSDTDFEDFEQINISQILANIQQLMENDRVELVVLTGVEPFRQPIEKLCDLLINNKVLSQIETNGVIYRPFPEEVVVVCSPKINRGFYIKPDPRFFLRKEFCLKCLVSATILGYQELPDFVHEAKNVIMQPIDEFNEELNRKNQKLLIDLSFKYGYKIFLQLHNILDIE